MSNEANKSTGLLSKVLGLVRGNGKEGAPLSDSGLAPDSRQELRELVERKRRNLAVRHQEFAQLRQLRQQGSGPGGTSLPVASQLPSQLSQQGDLKSTQTLRKIDVIEAQMSRQWWGDKLGAPPGPADLRQEGQRPPAGLALPVLQEVVPDTCLPPPVEPVQERRAVEFVPHPDLEEPAILFAHGDARAARTRLLEQLSQALGQPGADAAAVARLWHAALDLCRATGDEETFEPLAIDYAAHFGQSAPLWTSLPGQLGLPPLLGGVLPGAAAAPADERKSQWQSPAGVTASTVAALQATISRAAPPWCLSWQRLHSIDEAALPPLTALLHRWADAPGDYAWSYAGRLLQLLARHTVAQDPQVNPEWWLLRMAVLRFLHRMEEYDEVAVEYCIAYEVSPPSWQAPRHQCLVEEDGELDPTTVHDTLALAEKAPVPPGGVAAVPVQGEGLWGVLDGEIDACLQALEAKAVPGQPLEVDCSLLIRLDFVAAGGLLNWAAQMQAQGVALRFTHLHQLTAAFLTVLGVQEHAQLLLQPV